MKAKEIFIRFDADCKTGIGHFSRCLALGRGLRFKGFDVIFIAKNIDKGVENILKSSGMLYFKIPERISWYEEAQYLSCKYPRAGFAVILDIATLYAFKNIRGVSFYFKELLKHHKVIVLDGLGGNSLSSKIKAQVDIVIMPYFGAKQFLQKSYLAKNYLLGQRYYIFPDEYKPGIALKRKICLKGANRVLITMGGADPHGVTLKVIRSLRLIKNLKLEVRIIVGPNFSSGLRQGIYKNIELTGHDFKIIVSPVTLLQHMLWCDVAVTSSGLTKYELAITGTPSLQVSFNKDYAQVNKPFLREGAAKHLGVYNAVSCESLARELTALLTGIRRRLQMSQEGRKMIDARGMSRVVNAIRRLV